MSSSTADLGMPRLLAAEDADPRSVLLAAPRGYCAGVDRAVVTVEKALDLYGAPVYVRKQIVHNRHVVAGLEARGAVFVDELDEVPTGATVVFSAHGVSPAVHQQAEAPEDVAGIEVRDPARVAWLSQTTLSVDETLAVVDALRARFPQLLDPPSDDICYATQNRQQAVKEIARDADLVLVVGSGNSSNSVRLVEVALEAGARTAYRVDDAAEIDEAWLDGVRTVSVTSGASVPEQLVEGVLSHLAERGYPDARAVRTAEESLVFALPPELRRDLRAAQAVGWTRARRDPGARLS